MTGIVEDELMGFLRGEAQAEDDSALPAALHGPGRAAGQVVPRLKQIRFQVEYKMMSDGYTPLFVDGESTQVEFWGFNGDIVRRLTRLCWLFDRQVNWDNPADERWLMPEKERTEFNALLPFVISEIQIALGGQWEIENATRSL